MKIYIQGKIRLMTKILNDEISGCMVWEVSSDYLL
jgi:hypothetical protein